MKIFISYAHVDEYRVRELVDILRDSSHDPWFDHRLVVGRAWEDQLLEAIQTCDRFLYALTPESVESTWCQWEFAQAVHAGKPVVPVLVQDKTALPGILGSIQYADFSKGPTPRSVAKLLGGIGIAQVIAPDEVPLLPPPHAKPERPVENTGGNVSLAAQLYDDAYALFRAKEYAEAQELLHDCLLIDAHHIKAQKLLVLVERRLQKEAPPIPTPPPQNLKTQAEEVKTVTAVPPIPEPEQPNEQQVSDELSPLPQNLPAQETKAAPTLEPEKPRVLRVSDILPPPFEWIEIPAGRVTLEDRHGVFDVPAFAIAKYPVTNAQYLVFVKADDGYRKPYWWDYSREAQAWRAQNPQPQPGGFAGDKRPREKMSWYDAVAFCRWLTARLNGLDTPPLSPLPMHGEGMGVGLPTEQQWQRAAQGDDGRDYPWGKKFDSKNCNTSESKIGETTDVDRYPQGASPFGVLDMAGNVWEWCLNEYDTPQNTGLAGDAQRVLRGGSWYFDQGLARAVYRDFSLPYYWYNYDGFRVVVASLIFKDFSEH